MRNLNFTTGVQAVLASAVVGVVCYLSLMGIQDAVETVKQLAILGFGFWLGSSRSSQAKDDKGEVK